VTIYPLKIQENDENGILRYNYAVALQLAGKRHQSVPLLEEIFQNKESVDYYVLLKATLTHLVFHFFQRKKFLTKRIGARHHPKRLPNCQDHSRLF